MEPRGVGRKDTTADWEGQCRNWKLPPNIQKGRLTSQTSKDYKASPDGRKQSLKSWNIYQNSREGKREQWNGYNMKAYNTKTYDAMVYGTMVYVFGS